MVGSAVVQEAVSGAFSFVRNNREELASQSRLVERLKMAYLELKFTLERSRKMPITEVSLLQRRMMIKYAFEECRDLLPVSLDDGAEQGVTPLSPSLPKRIIHAVKPFFSTTKGSISASCVGRFEWFAEKADKFLRDVESGCSLALYRFSSPLITQLLEGKYLYYEMVSGSQTLWFAVFSCCLEDYGAMAYLIFDFKDLETPMKCFDLRLMLRLSDSTDIVGICTKCLESLEPQFKRMADVVSGELPQMSTQVGFFLPDPALREGLFDMTNHASTSFRQEPLCCIGDGFQPSTKNNSSSKLTQRFPEQVSLLRLKCFISAAEYNLQSSTVERNRNTIKAWPILQLSVEFLPHLVGEIKADKVGAYALIFRGEMREASDCLDLSKIAEYVPIEAIDFFTLEPDRTEYVVLCYLGHGFVKFSVNKPSTQMGCASRIGDRSKTRRVSKRKR